MSRKNCTSEKNARREKFMSCCRWQTSAAWMICRACSSSKYPWEVRRLIYTTNAIEGFNRQLRKVTKVKSVFPTDVSLLKILYLAMADITKK